MEKDQENMDGPEQTRQRILQAASEVFSGQGYARATTRQIAAAAGVNEVTLFRQFGSKENLFKALIERYGGPAVAGDLRDRLSGDLHRDLEMLGSHLLNLLLERKEVVRLMLCESMHFPELRQTMAQNPAQLRKMLAAYFRDRIQAGELRGLNPDLMAQAFWGMVFSYAVAAGMLEDDMAPDMSRDELVAGFVKIFLEGTQLDNRPGIEERHD